MNGNLYALPIPPADAFSAYCGGNAAWLQRDLCEPRRDSRRGGLFRHP